MKLKKFNGAKGYEKLSMLPFNRDFSARPSLVKSMQKHGFIVPAVACWSDAIDGTLRLYILDGQNRCASAAFLNIPFYVAILDVRPTTKRELVALVAKMNNSAVPWNLKVYSQAFASLGMSDYVTLNKLHHIHSIPLSVLSGMLSGKGANQVRTTASNDIKEGTFKINALNHTKKTIDLIGKLGKPMSGRMVSAFHNVRLTVDKFNFQTFKSNFLSNYQIVEEKSYDSYVDLFKTFC